MITSPRRARMSFLDRWLAAWILLAMVAGLLIGRLVPAVEPFLSAMEIGDISVPIALGLMVVSVVLNWVVGPAFMFLLAWTFLPDEPELRTGLIIVGLARCIAMVLIWSDLSCGDREATAVLVAINSVFQVIMFGVLGWFY